MCQAFRESEGGVDTKHRPVLEAILALRRARDAVPEDSVVDSVVDQRSVTVD